jgi:hypothetical protein
VRSWPRHQGKAYAVPLALEDRRKFTRLLAPAPPDQQRDGASGNVLLLPWPRLSAQAIRGSLAWSSGRHECSRCNEISYASEAGGTSMERKRVVASLCFASLIPLANSTLHAAAGSAGACAAAKRKATGKKAFDELKCQAIAVQRDLPVDPRCLERAAAEFARSFARAEQKGSCPTVGDAATLGAQVDAFVSSVIETLSPASCAGAGQVVGGHCWYLGGWGQSCTEVCAATGGTYDTATSTFAGSEGSDANCVAIMQALVPSAFVAGAFSAQDCATSGWGGLGCWALPPFFLNTWAFERCVDPPTTGDASAMLAMRACACL